MGYNGGTNKRGYYRRNHGMYSKSSYRSGERILSNLIVGGLGLIGAGISALSDVSETSNSNVLYKEEHFDLRSEKIKYIICGILSMLCPIAGYITYVYADWWLFFSIFVFGGIGLIISSVTLLFDTDFSNGKYLYKDEIETMTIKCQEILKLHKIFTILSTVLNLYPFIFIVSEIINPPSYYEDEISGLSVVWAFINIAISIAFVIGAFSDYKNLGNTLSEHSRIRKDKNCSQSKSSPIELQVNPIPVKEDRMKEVMTKEIQSKEISTEAPSKDIKLPKISGEYVENFYGPHSKLHIRANSAEIQFYFPGPDLRYNGTFFTIHDYEIDDYIRAYRANWIKAKELYEKAKELPGTTLRLSGERKMNIEATQNYFTIYLHQYHLPIKTEEGYQNIVEQLQIAKLRIEEIRNKLFV